MVIAGTARRHGVSDDDILHAHRNAIRAFTMDEGLTMWIGPGGTGDLLEVGTVQGDTALVVVHAMRARTKFLPRR